MTPFRNVNRVTSPFGDRSYWYNGKLVEEHHNGIDVCGNEAGQSAPNEDWVVREVTGGKVVNIAYDQWRGNYIDVQTAPGVIERYQHMASIYKKVGDEVPQGTHLGMAGTTGQSTGVHLHFEVQVNGVPVEPSAWLGLPNKKGEYPGNNDYDDTPEPEPQGDLAYRVKTANKCQAFNAKNVNDVFAFGDSMYMPLADYKITNLEELPSVGDFKWAQIVLETGVELWVVYDLPDKRCEIVEWVEPTPVDPEIEKLQKELAEAQEEIAILQAHAKNLSEENAKLIAENAELKKKLQEINTISSVNVDFNKAYPTKN